MKRLIILAVALCCVFHAAKAFTPAGAPTAEIVVPLRVIERNNMMIVSAKVDGAPCALLFDTGATHTSLDASFASKVLTNSTPVEVAIAGDTNVKSRPVALKVAELEIGEAKFTDFSVMSVDLGHLPKSVGEPVVGVLGMNVISRVPTLLSAGSGRVVFNPGVNERNGFARPVRSASPDPLEIVFGIRKGGKPFPVLVDSGASMTFMNAAHWPRGTNNVAIAASDVNGSSGLNAAPGERAELPLGIPVEIFPMVGDSVPDCIGADTLKRYDMLMEAPFVSFRKFR